MVADTGKILTVSVAAYNVKDVIRETLDSLAVPDVLDKIEVFVIDDGGTDTTLDIAREYEARYPGTFHAIHKENGGYGSTVNWSLAHATGKYFKLLDGDDWYDSASLPDFIARLEATEADVVLTPYKKVGMRSGNTEIKMITKGHPHEEQQYPVADLPVRATDFNMHYICWKTAVLHTCGLCLTEHRFYTDVEYALLPLPHVKTALIWDSPVYCYRSEVDGQSMSIASMVSHFSDHNTVFWRLMDAYIQTDRNNDAHTLMRGRLGGMASTNIRIMCLQPTDESNHAACKAFGARLREVAPEVLHEAMHFSKLVFALVKTNFAIFPFVHCYCVWKMRRSRGGGD